MRQVFQEAVALSRRGEPFVIATVVRTKGSTPQKPGAKLLVRQDGVDAIHILDVAGIYLGYSRVRIGASQNFAVNHPRQLDVAGVFGLSRQFLRQIATRDRNAYIRCAHYLSLYIENVVIVESPSGLSTRIGAFGRRPPHRLEDPTVRVAPADIA